MEKKRRSFFLDGFQRKSRRAPVNFGSKLWIERREHSPEARVNLNYIEVERFPRETLHLIDRTKCVTRRQCISRGAIKSFVVVVERISSENIG